MHIRLYVRKQKANSYGVERWCPDKQLLAKWSLEHWVSVFHWKGWGRSLVGAVEQRQCRGEVHMLNGFGCCTWRLGEYCLQSEKTHQNSPEAGKKICSEKFRLNFGLPKRIEMGLIAVYFHRRKNPKSFCCKWNTSRKHHQLWVAVRHLRRNSRHYFWWHVWITLEQVSRKVTGLFCSCKWWCSHRECL